MNFKINTSSGALRLEVYDNTLMGKNSIGFYQLTLLI